MKDVKLLGPQVDVSSTHQHLPASEIDLDFIE
jgi:hypothetical protein